MEQLNCKLQVKSLDEQGRFSGLASTYLNVDLGGDIVMPGAFTKTLQSRGGEVPLLFAHDMRQPIGLGKLTDTAAGLQIEGQLVLADVPKAREAYSLLKAKVLRGLSIGYDTVKSDVVNGARRLLELKLFEVSLVTVAMNELATVASVKGESGFADLYQLREMIRQCREGWR
jgi:HK97 family phage prohead protease